MRDWLAACVATLGVGGCSFIYNPNNIDNKSGDGGTHPVDVEKVVDVNPAALTLTSLYPTTIYEGVGFGNSLPALVVVRGEEIAATATVTVTADTGPQTQIDVRGTKVAGDHRWIAISIAVPIDALQDETAPHATPALTLTVTVDNGAGNVKTLSGLQVQFLDQLTAPITAPPLDTKRYSQINVTLANPFTAGTTADRVHLRSESSIVFGAGLSADASGSAPGPGGCAGGAANAAGAAKTHSLAVCSSGSTSGGSGGGGAGHSTNGVQGSASGLSTPATPGLAQGAKEVPQLSLDVGGGGGGGAAAGGGGGGTIYLDAAGDLNVTGTISANGAAGTNGNLGGGGGGGAGGTVLLKAGGTLTVGTVTVTGSAGGGGVLSGGAGSDGRFRFDASAGTSTGAGFQGASFKVVPYFSEVPKVASGITVIGPIGVQQFTGQAYDSTNAAPSDGAFSLSFGGGGIATPTPMLSPGYNRICISVPSGNVLAYPEAGTCAEIAYLPPGS